MSEPKPHLWKLRGTWYCAIVHRSLSRATPVLVPWRDDLLPRVMPDEPIGTGATPGEAGTVWRLVKHGRRYQTATASPAP
jgi:hypothetical protein